MEIKGPWGLVLKTGLEPASLTADAPKASVCAIPPLEQMFYLF